MDLMTAIDQLMIEADLDALPAWEGLPLHFTAGYIDPEGAIAALRRRDEEHRGERGTLRGTHMWFPAATGGRLDLPGHDLYQFTADLRCDFWIHLDQDGNRLSCSCVGDFLTMTICTRCTWHHIASHENAAVDAWHDHAFPGWRGLPIFPENLRGGMGSSEMTPQRRAWIDENYPEAFRVDGAPIRTTRGSRIGSRHVPGYSPLGGYDLAADSEA